MNPDLVYLSTTANNGELKYALRAVEVFGINFGKVIVVGHLPRGLKPDIFVPHKNNRGYYKSRDMFEKINLIAQNKEVSERFIRMSDDYFFSSPFDFKNAPTFIRDHDLLVQGSRAPNNKNNQVATVTGRTLQEKGLPIISYDLHAPMPMEKSRFLQITKAFDWTKPLSLAIRSVYGNYHKIKGVVKKDIKFGKYYDYDMVIKEPIWSTGDMFWCDKTMEKLYPNKSRWEI